MFWASIVATALARACLANGTHTVTGDVRYHRAFHSDVLHNARDIAVWLPPGYAEHPNDRYPVLYLQDGQNCFDAATAFAGEWHCDETTERLIRAGVVEPIIMVAVANVGHERLAEYTPTADPHHPQGGHGDAYEKFLIDELKPMIDCTYRSRPGPADTAIGGSSLGALVALDAGYRHPEVFGRLMIMSPSLWWDGRNLLKQIQASAGPLVHERVWIDIGTLEGDDAAEQAESVANAKSLAAAVSAAGSKSVIITVAGGAKHNEAAWSARFGDALTFMFPFSNTERPEPVSPGPH